MAGELIFNLKVLSRQRAAENHVTMLVVDVKKRTVHYIERSWAILHSATRTPVHTRHICDKLRSEKRLERKSVICSSSYLEVCIVILTKIIDKTYRNSIKPYRKIMKLKLTSLLTSNDAFIDDE
jgi:hypothetical protein